MPLFGSINYIAFSLTNQHKPFNQCFYSSFLQPVRDHEMIAQNCQALESQNANEEHEIIIEQSTTLIKETSKMKEEHKLISQQTRSLSTEAIEWVKRYIFFTECTVFMLKLII